MGKRKGKEPVNESNSDEGADSKFFACYLLTSLSPRFKGHTYIGFTVNPRRRIRQHNGEVTMGAWRTKKKRPWEMVLCIYGFPSNVSALQFEWAWQHPVESRAVRQAAASFKTLGGVANKIKLAYTMLTLPEWRSLNLTVNFFSSKYKMHSASCPSLPEQMRVQILALDELPCYTGIDMNEYTHDDWDNGENCEGSSERSSNEGPGESSTASNVSARNQDSVEEHVDELNDLTEDLSARNQGCVEEHVDELNDLTEEVNEPAEENSSLHKGYTDQTYIVIDSPVNSSYIGSFGISDHFKNPYKLEDEFGLKLSPETNKPCLATVDAFNKDVTNAGLACETEVIDVFTPPCYKVADSKKRRLSTACSEIIDLTNSPIFL